MYYCILMDSRDIIKYALKKYDETYRVIEYLKNNTKYSNTHAPTGKRSVLKFYDSETEKLVLTTEYEFYGVYFNKYKLWAWAWALPDSTIPSIYLVKELLIYGVTADKRLYQLKSILTTSKGIINDITQLDINLAVGSYIIKQPYIYPHIKTVENADLINYVILLNTEDLDKLDKELAQKEKSI